MADFADQVVMITGSTGNLGRAITQKFSDAGARLVLADLSVDHQHEEHADLAQSERHYLASPVDMTDPDSVAAMVEQTLRRFGQIDVLINGVGGYRAGTPLHETPLQTWDFMLDINARTVFIASQAVIPHMLERARGKIISVAARPGLEGKANIAAYAASKSAVLRLTESMAAEVCRHNVNVNCVLPGTIDTPQNRAAMPDADPARWVQPASLADVILFLASDAARDIQGAAIPVYGRT